MEPEAATTPVPIATAGTSVEVPLDADCVYLGLDERAEMNVRLSFSSSLPMAADIAVLYALIDSTGTQFATANQPIERVFPNEKLRYRSTSYQFLPRELREDAGISCQISEIVEIGPHDRAVGPLPTDTCAVVGLELGAVQLEVNVTSPFAEVADLTVSYSLSVDGERYATEPGQARNVGPGDSVSFTTESFSGVPDWSLETPTCQVLTISDQ